MQNALRSLLFLCALVSSAGPALAQGTGVVSGRVTDAATGAPLAGADVTLDGTAFTTAADRTGGFRLVGVPAGEYSLLVLYLGHAEQRAAVTVTAGQTLTVDIQLASASFSELVQVTGEPIGEGQARALNQQRTALNITNVVAADQIGSFPDPNAAEAASRIPGVSIARDQGEGRYVLVRGTESRLNAMMIDGERIPSPEGDTRSVALDAVPADQLQAIEVSKAVTPDMDADSIGGAVNLITRQAVDRPTMLFSLGTGYNALQDDYGQQQAAGTVGRRFAGGRAGFMLGGSASALDRGSENFEAEYDDGFLDVLELRDYIVNRERYGVNGALDVRASDTTQFVVRGIFNRFRDYEVNNRKTYDVGGSRIERIMKNRQQNQTIQSLSGTGQHLFGDMTVDYRASWGRSREEQPNRLDTEFRQSRVQFAPNVTPTSIDPDNIQANPLNEDPDAQVLNAWIAEPFETSDRDLTASLNVRIPIGSTGDYAGFLKAGAKVRDKRKEQAADVVEYEPDGDIPFSQLRSDFDGTRFLRFHGAGYVLGPGGIDADRSRALWRGLPASAAEFDHESDAEDYAAEERVVAGYVMAELFLGQRLLVLPGLRYESTRVDYDGFEVLYNDDGDYEATRPLSGGDTNGFFLPGLHLRYSLSPSTNLRAAYTRTLARPNYVDLVPYQLVIQEDREIERGNPTLRPTTSNNIDLLAEHYFESVGLLSGGVFYKRLNDYIYPFRLREAAFGDVYEITQPLNGEAATLWGVELAYQQQLRFLPAPFDGLGVYANYTWTDSDATFDDRAEDATLPGQSKHLGNLSLWYEKRGFSAKASWNFHGSYLEEVGSDPSEDVFYDNHTQLDVNLSQRLTRSIRVYADFLNLTNAPLRYYIGTTTRPIQEEYYRWWAMFGVKMNF